jgi:hypothetical protein
MGLQSKSKAKLIVMKDNISKELTASALVGGTAILATTTGSLPVYDEHGNILGYIALFDTDTLV